MDRSPDIFRNLLSIVYDHVDLMDDDIYPCTAVFGQLQKYLRYAICPAYFFSWLNRLIHSIFQHIVRYLLYLINSSTRLVISLARLTK